MVRRDLAMVIPLSQVTTPDQAGSKAFGLAELARHRIPIPDTYVLPTDCEGLPGESILNTLGGCVAVRSSATAEDLVDASFAGQFKSFLNITSAEDLGRAIWNCRRSASSPAVTAYCSTRGIDASHIRMGVIIQRMVKATVAGVLFTIHPTRGCEDEMLIEACYGVADELLAGRRAGVQILIRQDRIPHSADILSKDQIERLIAIGGHIHALKGLPQDIEWAFEGEDLYILQARPITRLCFAGIGGEWTNADFRDGGVASDVVTPLMWSLYEFVWERALKGYLRDIHLLSSDFQAARVFYGRPYWNLGAVKACVRKLPGFVEREFDRDLAVQPKYSGDGVRTPVSLCSMLKAIPTVLAVRQELAGQEARDHTLLAADLGQWFERDPRRLGDPELLEGFRGLVEHAYLTIEKNYFRTIFCLSIAKLNLKAVVKGLPISYAKLVGGLEDLKHFECAQALWELANRNLGTLESHLLLYGHHSRRELDLRIPRWSEEAGFVREMAQKLVGTESPEAMNRRQREQFAVERGRALRLLPPWRRKRFEKSLGQLRRFLWLREQMRDLSTRMYAEIRRFTLEIGRRAAASGHLLSPDDIFYLTCLEIRQVFSVPQHIVVQERRSYEQKYRNFLPPNEVGRGFAQQLANPNGHGLSGIGCSSGVASGVVRIVTDLRDSGKLQPGNVLVCPYTDPGWTPLLSIAGAVVTETGGLLSHAAVICREYGIPAVLNVAGATQILRDGQAVRVDGENGHVDLH